MDYAVIREIQEALRRIGSRDMQFPFVAVDGIYSPQTARAITIFQRKENLPVTGEVDPITFERLITEAANTVDDYVAAVPAFPHPSHVIHPLQETESIPFVKAMLNALSVSYTNIPYVGTSAVYDENTVKAIRELQRLHNRNDDGIIDRDIWNILVALFANRPTLRSDRP